MNIIIAGSGKVGSTLAQQLAAEGHNLTIIDSKADVISADVDRMDVIAVHGNCASKQVLMDAGVMDADLLIAAAGADEVNLLCCTTAHGLNRNLHTIARIRNPEYTEQIYEMRDVFGLSLAINPERQAAVEMERLLKYPGFLRRDTFARARSEIVELRIDASSKLCNVPLIEMAGIVKCRVLVCAVLRNGTALVPNSGSFVLKEGDRIFVTAPPQNLTTLLKNLGIIPRRARNVMLCGGGRVSYYLAKLLEKDRISVKLIEQDLGRCTELAALLPDTNIIHGDATDQAFLENEGLSDCDALVTMTGLDELNMIISLSGSNCGVPQVITKLSRMHNRSIADNLTLGSVVCPKELCCNTIIRYVRAMQNQAGAAVSIHFIADGQVEAMEFQVREDNPYIGIPLKKICPKPNVLVATITHGARTEIANGESVFYAKDTVVIVAGSRGGIHSLRDIFDYVRD